MRSDPSTRRAEQVGDPLPESYFGELLQDREPPGLGSVSVYSQCLAWNLEQRRGSTHTC